MVLLNRSLEAAIGWLELGLPAEGLRELDALAPERAASVEAMELRAVLLQQLNRWEEAAATYADLCRRPDAAVERFIAWGCCLYELNRIADCRTALLAAPAAARSHGLWNFHLACYESILGHKDEARRLISRALELEPGLRAMAEQNDNLIPLLSAR